MGSAALPCPAYALHIHAYVYAYVYATSPDHNVMLRFLAFRLFVHKKRVNRKCNWKANGKIYIE